MDRSGVAGWFNGLSKKRESGGKQSREMGALGLGKGDWDNLKKVEKKQSSWGDYIGVNAAKGKGNARVHPRHRKKGKSYKIRIRQGEGGFALIGYLEAGRQFTCKERTYRPQSQGELGDPREFGGGGGTSCRMFRQKDLKRAEGRGPSMDAKSKGRGGEGRRSMNKGGV